MTETVRQPTEADTRNERAQRAVKAFRALQPTLSSYARVYTGKKDIRVEISNENPHTDGKTIFFRPPMELGDLTPHVRKLCDKRDEVGRQRCNACGIRERVLIAVYHEIAHISEGTFDKPTDDAFSKAIERAIDEAGGHYAEQIRERLSRVPVYNRNSYMSLSGIVSPFLPLIVNALEDARINNRLFEARRGTKPMFDSFMSDVFENGVEQKDEQGNTCVKHWRDYPLNAQVVTGLFCRAAGYMFDNWFDPEVVKALHDEKLGELLDQARDAKWAGETYELSFPVLARLRELGFCKSERDPEPPPEPEPQPEPEPEPEKPEQEEESDEADEQGEPSDGSDESESEDGVPDEDESSGEGESPDGEGEPEDEDRSEGGDGGEESDSDTQADQDLSDDLADDSEPKDGSDGDDGDSGDSEQDSPESESDSADNGEAGQSEDAGDTPTDESGDASSSEAGVSDDEGTSEQESEPQDDGESADSAGSDRAESDGGDAGDSTDEPHEDMGDSVEGEHGHDRDDVDSEPSDSSDGEVESAEDGRQDAGSELQPDLGDSGRSDRDSQEPSDDVEGNREAGDEVEDDSNAEPVDTGADKGEGGINLEGKEMGDPSDVKKALTEAMMHGDKPESVEQKAESRQDKEALKIAIIQGQYFETPSVNVSNVRVNRFGKPVTTGEANAWGAYEDQDRSTQRNYGVDGEFDPDESVLGPALLKMRRVFADNRRGKKQKNLKSGRINTRVLGRRAPTADPRLFKHSTQPGKKDYAVVIGLDISGSTAGVNIGLEKRAVMAQANLLSRMGIDFAIVAHSAFGGRNYWAESGATLDIYVVKDWNEPWSESVKEGLRKLGPYSGNLDGHALEYMRKMVERTTATDKVLMYYSDGKMPAMNHAEELEILQREIAYCRRKNIVLLGVGIRTDSPSRHGLDTVQVEEDRDVEKVVKHLEKHLDAAL